MKNQFNIVGNTVRILIKSAKHGKFVTLVSLEDLGRLLTIPCSWNASPNKQGSFYVQSYFPGSGKGAHPVSLHRFLMDAPSGYFVDHINHDTLDNRKSNLRIVTPQENADNRSTHSVRSNKSGMRGVVWDSKCKRWRVRMMINNRDLSFGYYDRLEDAKQAAANIRASLVSYSPDATEIKDPSMPEKESHNNHVNKRQPTRKRPISGVRGVCWHKTRNEWYVRFSVDGKVHNFGYFKKLDDAIRKAQDVSQQYNIPL